MRKAVIFDLDDTLISEKDYIQSGYLHVAQLLSKRIDVLTETIYSDLLELFKQNSKNVFNRLFDKYEIKYSKEMIMELVGEYRSHFPNISVFDDVIPCLNELKKAGIKTGIITDGYAIGQRQKIKAIDADKYFDEIIVTDELGREYWKPHPKAFEIMKELLNVRFSDMVYIGDNVTKDFVSPNRLGMKTVCISREQGIYDINKHLFGEDFHAVYSIKNLYDLSNILNERVYKNGENSR